MKLSIAPAARFWLVLGSALLPALAGCSESHAGGASTPATTPALATSAAAVQPTGAPAAETAKSAAAPVQPARPPGQVRDITFDTIKFTMDKKDPFQRSMITPQIEQLTGQPVRIRGYILPSFKQHGLTQFVLVRDNMQCCFGPGAALYDCVVVQMQPETSAEFSVRPVAVEGVFAIDVVSGPDDRPLAIYRLDGKSVK